MKNKIGHFLKLLPILPAWFLFSYSIAYASVETATETIGDLTIRRMAPETATLGQEIWIVVEIENNGVQERTITFVEKLANAEFDRSQAKSIEVFDPGYDDLPEVEGGERLKLWYYEWGIQLPPNESATLAYWLVPTTVGTYVISPAEITIDGEMFRTMSRDIIIKCNSDEQCDVHSGENYLTCPEDCLTGNADGFCDGASDGRIDPDCDEGYDPDASAAVAIGTPAPTMIPLPPEQPSPDLTPYLVIIATILIIIAVLVIVILLIRREQKRK
jgi:hypothetical protein